MEVTDITELSQNEATGALPLVLGLQNLLGDVQDALGAGLLLVFLLPPALHVLHQHVVTHLVLQPLHLQQGLSSPHTHTHIHTQI